MLDSDVKIIDAREVPMAKCNIRSLEKSCAVNKNTISGTNIVPPPMPKRPAKNPTKIPTPK
jgi:hypothetical protein